MTMTTRVQSVSIPVADQDRALAFYTAVRWLLPGGSDIRHVALIIPAKAAGLTPS
jgi:hypothetical protein